MQDRAEVVHENFLRRVKDENLPQPGFADLNAAGLTPAQFTEFFESQLLSRHLDYTTRKLQARGEGYYTNGSSGHEGNSAIAAAFRLDDMAMLHYRDAAFFIQRSKKLPGQTPLWDMLLSFTTSSEDPISGGRHCGVRRQQGPVHPAADQHHRFASAQGGRRGVQHRT